MNLSIQRKCDEARDLLMQAHGALLEAMIQAGEDGEAELAKALHTTGGLANHVAMLCISLPRLQDAPRDA